MFVCFCCLLLIRVCLKFVPARSIVVFICIFNPSVWVIVVAKRLVRLTKIRFFNFSETKIEFLLINGGILSVAHFCFRSTLIWLLFRKCTEKSSQTGLGLFIFVFYANDFEFIFPWSFQHLSTIGLIGFWRLIDRFLFSTLRTSCMADWHLLL